MVHLEGGPPWVQPTSMKVLIADQFEQSGIDAIVAAGCEVVYEPSLADRQLADALTARQPDVLIVRSTKVTEPMLADTTLSLIVRAGAGVNTIDVNAASRRGIYVSNCPGKNSIAVAELDRASCASAGWRHRRLTCSAESGQSDSSWRQVDSTCSGGVLTPMKASAAFQSPSQPG